ncbi:MAG TPA: serine/threonine protein kinase [Burkholderiaceae bacterium]|nr:serine/threonine protein kinase [Burkholderiaceae bacterium]
MSETTPGASDGRTVPADIGAGDPDAAAGAIPNLIAGLVETETWRNAATVLLGLLLIGLGYWTYTGVREALAETRAASLEALLGTVVKGLDVWAYEHMAEAQRTARNPTVVAQATQFVHDRRGALAEPGRCTQEAERLGAEVQARLSTSGVVAFRILDSDGRVLSSKDPRRCGQRIRSGVFRERLDRVFDGKPQFVRPFPDEAELSVRDADGTLRPVAWFMAPIRVGEGAPVAALAMGVATDRELETIFTAARPGATGEAYAFGDSGLMLSSSRQLDTPSIEGVPAPRPAPGERMHVRDPGGPVAEGYVPTLESAARPLTRAAALAIAARSKTAEIDRRGVIATPYRGYRGYDVIGAWQWLPAYDFGVAAEISADEAFSTLRYVTISLSVIGGIVALTLVAAFMSAYLLARLTRQFGRVQRLGAYTLERQISEGGMATIYLARHALLKRPTAIKILKKHVATDEFVHRFEREVQLASQLLHPNTVEIYDFGRTPEGQPYYVMEYLDGVTLAELVEHSGRVPPGRAIHILRQVAAALREAHARGMVHRDVKPENVMLCRRGEDDVVKLLDFGLVKNLERAETRDVTKQLKIVGTPRYMAPERLLNPSDVDARSDIYALGAVAYFLLTGKPIFEGDDSLVISNQVMHTPAPRVRAAGVEVPQGLDDLVAACLEKDRNRRPASAEAFIETLDRVASRLAWTQLDAAAWWSAYRKSRGTKAEPTT